MDIDKLLIDYKWYILITIVVLFIIVIIMFFSSKGKKQRYSVEDGYDRNSSKSEFVGLYPKDDRSPFSYGREPYYSDRALINLTPNFTPIFNKDIYEEDEEKDYCDPVEIEEYRKPIEKKSHTRISKGEAACLDALYDIFDGKYEFKSVRPKWLKNPKTGRSLELDCYNEDLNLAVEYQGPQHYVYPNCFHKTREEFDEQLYRDKIKLDMCDEKGVYVITVPYTVKIKDIKEFIIYYLPKNRKKRLDQNMTN